MPGSVLETGSKEDGGQAKLTAVPWSLSLVEEKENYRSNDNAKCQAQSKGHYGLPGERGEKAGRVEGGASLDFVPRVTESH